MSVYVILMFVASIGVQIAGASMWPLTRGFTRPLPTLAACVAQVIGLALLNLVIASGVTLSALMPLAAAAMPLASVLVGGFVYREWEGWKKVSMLLAACGLIAAANFL